MNERHDDRAVDELLRATFAPPPAAMFAAAARDAAQGPRVAGPRRWWPWAAAAAAVLAVLAMWPFARGRDAGQPDGAELGRLWAAAFHDAVARGFEGANCCETGLDLPSACQERFAIRLDVERGSSLALLGCYCGLPTGGCMAILAKDDGTPVCVCVVPRAQDPGVRLPAGSDLHLARRELGDLVLYSISAPPGTDALEEFAVSGS